MKIIKAEEVINSIEKAMLLSEDETDKLKSLGFKIPPADIGSVASLGSHTGIRPALRFANADMTVGDKIDFGDDTVFTVISPEYAICDGVIRMQDGEHEDNAEASVIVWFKEARKRIAA